MGTPKQFVKYPGSKVKLIAKHLACVPPHIHYVSVFGGTCPDILLKPRSAVETYNDKSRNLYSIYQCCQDDHKYQQLLKRFANPIEGRQLFADCLAIIRSPDEQNPVIRAWAYLVVGTICNYHKDPVLASNWRGSCRIVKRTLSQLPDVLQAYRDRFRHVNLECLDWRTIINKYDGPETLFYCDPTYPGSVLRSGADQYYEHFLTEQDHRELLDVLNKVQGYVMLCGYNNPLYTRYLFHWRKRTFETKAYMSKQKHKPKRYEQLWLNYEEDGSKLSSNKLLITQQYLDVIGGRDQSERFMDLLEKFKDIKPK